MKSIAVSIFCCLLSLSVLPVSAAPQDTLSMMTFNIRYGSAADGPNHWDLRKDMVFSVIEDQQPDVVGLQEALNFQIDQIKTAVPGYQCIGVGRDDGKTQGEYSALLYRPDRFEVQDSDTFWLSDTPEVVASITWGNACTRICTWALFKDKVSRRSFYVFNLHLDHVSQVSREKAGKLVLDRIAQRKTTDPVFVTGDFNAGEANPVIKGMKARALSVKLRRNASTQTVHLADTFRIIHPDAKSVGTANGFTSRTSGQKIDYIFAMDCLTILSADILRSNRAGRYPSDHFPVVATIAWPEG